jgi:hypothetical protein
MLRAVGMWMPTKFKSDAAHLGGYESTIENRDDSFDKGPDKSTDKKPSTTSSSTSGPKFDLMLRMLRDVGGSCHPVEHGESVDAAGLSLAGNANPDVVCHPDTNHSEYRLARGCGHTHTRDAINDEEGRTPRSCKCSSEDALN